MTGTEEHKSAKRNGGYRDRKKSKPTKETATQPTVAIAAEITVTTAVTAKTILDNSSSIQVPKTTEKVFPTGKGSSLSSVEDVPNPEPTISAFRPTIPHARGPVSSYPAYVSHNSDDIKSPSEGYPSHQRPRQSVDTTKKNEGDEEDENEIDEDEDEGGYKGDDDVVLEPELIDADNTVEEATDMKEQKSHSKRWKHMEKRRVEMAKARPTTY
ncbi:hypothetical protein BGX34_002387 [Mortierella sp. NVP85]|nr:hypothetical protein BGX34_002387 [Mortierella sp. NVP85]